MLNPGISNKEKDDKKERAKPNSKIEIKQNNRLPDPKKEETAIWKTEELKEENIQEDGRPKPEYDVYKNSY